MAKLELQNYFFIEISAELPNGKVSLFELLPKIEKYNIIPIEEIIRYRSTGDGVPERFQMKLWITRTDYQPLANRLGKLGFTPKPTVTRFAPF